MQPRVVVVLISAGAEWRSVLSYYPESVPEKSPLGDWFCLDFGQILAIFFHGGWGKVPAAASAQYVIDRWHPEGILNMGTCGGFAGRIEKGEIICATSTWIYDIYEQMGDADAALEWFSTSLDMTWLHPPYPQPVKLDVLLSADRDILPQDVSWLVKKFSACAADWESGAIAWTAKKNGVRCLILRGVTDLVNDVNGEAYGNIALFHEGTTSVIRHLLDHVGEWVQKITNETIF